VPQHFKSVVRWVKKDGANPKITATMRKRKKRRARANKWR
jgi:hypothetical protein